MRFRAVLALAAFGVLGVAALVFPPPSGRPGPFVTDPARPTDAKMFESVVVRLRSGEPYYQAMGDALRRGDYPVGSPFNWRTPLHLVAVATVPWLASRAVLTGLLVSLFAVTMASIRGPSLLVATIGGLQLGLVALQSAHDAVYLNEIWSGTLIGLSVCAFGLRRTLPAVALGIAALFVRELAAPYCVACVLMATWARQRRECAAWLVGAAAYAGYYAWHVAQVVAHLGPTDAAAETDWVTLGGLPFLQSALRKLGWLSLLPDWVTALTLVALVAGITRSAAPAHARAGAAAFVGFFLIAGLPFNDYWGWLAAPIWAIVCGHGVVGLWESLRRASGRGLSIS